MTLPDVLSPDWTLIRRDVDLELEDGIERAFVNIPGAHLAAKDESELVSFERSLRKLGVDVRVRRALPFGEVFFG